MTKQEREICRAICEIRCVCVLLGEGRSSLHAGRYGQERSICKAMAENIIKTTEETPQNPEYRFKHLSEEPIG